jgi:hypothetical protein
MRVKSIFSSFLFLLVWKNNEGCFCMVFVVGQVGVGTQVNGKQAAMQLSLRKDNHNWAARPDMVDRCLCNYL